MSTSENPSGLTSFAFNSFVSKTLHWQANEGRSLNAFLSKLTSKMGEGTPPFHPVKKLVFGRLSVMSAEKSTQINLKGPFSRYLDHFVNDFNIRNLDGFGLDCRIFRVLIRSLCLRLFSRLKINFKIHDYLIKLFNFLLTHYDRTWDRFHL